MLSRRPDRLSASSAGGAVRLTCGRTLAGSGPQADCRATRTDSSTSNATKVSTSAASVNVVAIDATTCTECSPKRSTVESNPVADDESPICLRRRSRPLDVASDEACESSGHPRGPINPGRLPRDAFMTTRAPPSAGITPVKHYLHNTRRRTGLQLKLVPARARRGAAKTLGFSINVIPLISFAAAGASGKYQCPQGRARASRGRNLLKLAPPPRYHAGSQGTTSHAQRHRIARTAAVVRH